MEKRTAILELDSGEYSLVKMPPTRALSFAPQVAKLIAGSLSEGVSITDLTEDNLIKLVTSALTNIDPDEFTLLFKTAVSYETFSPGGNRLSNDKHFDEWFSEHPGEMFAVCAWAVWEHSKDFFTGATGPLSKVFSG